jgi:ABC-type multidrug transport system fused ATPase/permease subunit
VWSHKESILSIDADICGTVALDAINLLSDRAYIAPQWSFPSTAIDIFRRTTNLRSFFCFLSAEQITFSFVRLLKKHLGSFCNTSMNSIFPTTMENIITTEEEKDAISKSAIASPDAPSHDSSHNASDFGNDMLPPDIVSWFSSTAQTRASHATASTPKSLGVSYQDLNVYGFRTTSDYHHTVVNYPLRLASVFTTQKSRNKSKVNILQGFDGVIQSGEMLLVLGRPGSGCSTFLKTLAGEMHGIYLGAKTKLNYRGSCRLFPLIINVFTIA